MSVTLTAAEERARDAIRQSILLIITATIILTILGIVMVFSATSVSSISMDSSDGSKPTMDGTSSGLGR